MFRENIHKAHHGILTAFIGFVVRPLCLHMYGFCSLAAGIGFCSLAAGILNIWNTMPLLGHTRV